MDVVFEIAEEVDGVPQTRYAVVLLLQVLCLDLFQVGQPVDVLVVSVFSSLSPLAAVGQVVGVGHGDLLQLVVDQGDATPHLGRHRPFEAALAEQAVDRLNLIPTCCLKERINRRSRYDTFRRES